MSVQFASGGLFWTTFTVIGSLSLWTHSAFPEQQVVGFPRAVGLEGYWPELHSSRIVPQTMPSGFNVEYAGRPAALEHALLEAGHTRL